MAKRPLTVLILALGLLLGALALRHAAPRKDAVEIVQAKPWPIYSQKPVLPEGWPIPELNMPPGALPAPIHPEADPLHRSGADSPMTLKGVRFNSGTDDSGYLYGVGLHLPGGFAELAAHVEGKLQPLGYDDHWSCERPDGSIGREYISPDRMFVVQIFYWGETGNCHLEVFAYNHRERREARTHT
jgi:hypothetical protein